VKGGAIGQGCGHFLPSECPDDLVAPSSPSGLTRADEHPFGRP
jgi:hypothetical protein